MSRRKKIGLALGGGGARGLAHIGIINALVEMGVEIDVVAGTSIGAIAGASFASGNIAGAMEWAERSIWKKLPTLLFDLHISKRSLINGERIEKELRRKIPVKTFEELKIPFAAVATDLATGEEVVLREGGLHSAVRASMAVPGVFSPVKRNDRILVDGGLVNPLPIDVCRNMGAQRVIAVDINGIGGNSLFKPFEKMNIFDVLDATVKIINNQRADNKMELCESDILLQPPVQEVSLLDFRKANNLVKVGYDYAMSCKDRILYKIR